MIGRLKGTLLEKNAPWVLVDVQGVGYELQVPMSTLFNLPEINAPCLHIWLFAKTRTPCMAFKTLLKKTCSKP